MSSTDDSLVNYDMFEVSSKGLSRLSCFIGKSFGIFATKLVEFSSTLQNHAMQMANSSIIGQQENIYGNARALEKPAAAIKTPIKANLTGRSIQKSPLKATNFTQIKTTKVIDI